MEKINFETGAKLSFIIESTDNPPDIEKDNGGFQIAFVPFEGFQWCKYHNGSKSWMSMVTMKTVQPTQWLRLLN